MKNAVDHTKIEGVPLRDVLPEWTFLEDSYLKVVVAHRESARVSQEIVPIQSDSSIRNTLFNFFRNLLTDQNGIKRR